MRRFLPLFLLFTLCIPAFPAAAQGASLLDLTLRDLASPGRISLAQYQGQPAVMVFFEPECPWCFRQVRVLNRLLAQCPGQFQPLAVGTNGSRRALMAEYRRLRPDFPAFQISSALLDRVGTIPATPFTLLIDRHGAPAGWLRGFMPQEKLTPVLAAYLGVTCGS
ncbi:TlpA family protein disulfide reductase [Microbulbifer sp. 2304DJ12-6]|uniref:TlpA family protein disulfide reductase n=1 Tax=Microbulbifer sp. 2304DJ12-6 TaxID=3233340 RepID=UPI0039B01C4D